MDGSSSAVEQLNYSTSNSEEADKKQSEVVNMTQSDTETENEKDHWTAMTPPNLETQAQPNGKQRILGMGGDTERNSSDEVECKHSDCKLKCCLCNTFKDKDSFSKNQNKKMKIGKEGKCKTCLASAEVDVIRNPGKSVATTMEVGYGDSTLANKAMKDEFAEQEMYVTKQADAEWNRKLRLGRDYQEFRVSEDLELGKIVYDLMKESEWTVRMVTIVIQEKHVNEGNARSEMFEEILSKTHDKLEHLNMQCTYYDYECIARHIHGMSILCGLHLNEWEILHEMLTDDEYMRLHLIVWGKERVTNASDTI